MIDILTNKELKARLEKTSLEIFDIEDGNGANVNQFK